MLTIRGRRSDLVRRSVSRRRDLQSGELRAKALGDRSTARGPDRFAGRPVCDPARGGEDASKSQGDLRQATGNRPCCFPFSAGWPRSARMILTSCEIWVYFTPRPIDWARPSTRSRPISTPHRWPTTSRRFAPWSKPSAARSPGGTENKISNRDQRSARFVEKPGTNTQESGSTGRSQAIRHVVP